MAGTSMKDIKLRIRSVESTLQITKAMQLVAASKIRRARERMENSKAYAEIASKAAAALAAHCDTPNNVYLEKREGDKRCYAVIAGERGLAGGYNANVFKAVEAHAAGSSWCVYPFGRKAIEKYERLGKEVLSAEFPKVEGFTVGECSRVAQEWLSAYREGKFQELYLVYTGFRSMMAQEVRLVRLLPLEKEAEKNEGKAPVSTIWEPNVEEALDKIMPDYLTGRLYSALCDSYVSEVAARRSAMDSASKNADAMIGDLTLKFNRARQGAITQEITEIVAGAEE